MTAAQVIVGARVIQKEVDRNLLHPVLDVTRQLLPRASLRPKFRTVVADSGYVTEDAFRLAHEQHIRLLAP